jgi:SAM-dependent methyltransferase
MAVAVKSLLNKRKVALARARFRAWWEGEAFDAEAAQATIDAAANDADALAGDVESALFDPPAYQPPPRLAALAVMWGEGRVRPGDAASEAVALAPVQVQAQGVLAVLGPGGPAPVLALAAIHPGQIQVFEWREETLEAQKLAIAKAGLEERVKVASIDLEAHVFAQQSFDALLSIDDFAYASYAPHLAQQIFKALKPGARGLLDAYVGFKLPEHATAFATSFAEPQIRPHGDLLQILHDTGLIVASDDDLTDDFARLAREGFTRLSQNMDAVAKLDVRGAQELAWEVEAWRMRLKLLGQRRLERRRIVVERPSADPSEA